ncbi:tRNA1(Val) (adenine(37)-N6)-methyltransferase [Salsuginibacillus kocurii]|uniref:tRNA1(Val) (adenine(37)-N6)-methyltransferase n=1 Tax=Salsuginibacillus kocurii TaxID=427078 RepID=UPI00037BDFDA|nr:tRNA1(Val) (adenine(37)-N6)-methyltransferase [Salsuginibacillus kocurii]
MDLRVDEHINYINNRLQIIQSDHVFSFSIDAVLLAQFVGLSKSHSQVMDLCTGNGVIPLVLSERSKAAITGLELQPRLAEMARRSIAMNQQSEQIKIVEGDVKDAGKLFALEQYDIVTCNPPYFRRNTEQAYSQNPYVAIARHEMYCTLADVLQAAGKLLKQRGKFACVYRPERLVEVFETMRAYQLEPKRVCFIHPKKSEAANLVLIEAMKGGKAGLLTLPALAVYDEQNQYTEEFLAYYEGEN